MLITKEQYFVVHNTIDNETTEMINRLFGQKCVGVWITTNGEEFIQKLEDYIDRQNFSVFHRTSK